MDGIGQLGQGSLMRTCTTNTHRAHLVAYSRWDASALPFPHYRKNYQTALFSCQKTVCFL
jgi:hypothetical protein